MDLELIRDESIGAAKRLGVDVSPMLPLLDAGLEIRDADEAVSRLLTMNAVAATAYGFDRAKAIAWLNQEGLIDSLSVQERDFIFEGLSAVVPLPEIEADLPLAEVYDGVEVPAEQPSRDLTTPEVAGGRSLADQPREVDRPAHFVAFA